MIAYFYYNHIFHHITLCKVNYYIRKHSTDRNCERNIALGIFGSVFVIVICVVLSLIFRHFVMLGLGGKLWVIVKYESLKFDAVLSITHSEYEELLNEHLNNPGSFLVRHAS